MNIPLLWALAALCAVLGMAWETHLLLQDKRRGTLTRTNLAWHITWVIIYAISILWGAPL